jgi:hypothetical protein
MLKNHCGFLLGVRRTEEEKARLTALGQMIPASALEICTHALVTAVLQEVSSY